MDGLRDTIAQLAQITEEMTLTPDPGGQKLNDLLAARAALIHKLIAGRFDVNDIRLDSIMANAGRLQERLQKRADSLREELSALKSTAALMAAVRSTLTRAESTALDVKA